MKQIVPSIIAISNNELKERINKVKDAVDLIQLDIMDGTMTPTHTLDFDFTLPENSCHIEAHLMLKDPLSWISQKADLADTIIFHVEAGNNSEDINKIISVIKEKGKKVGIAIAPETKADAIFPYLSKIDQVLVFTADKIGYYGAKFSEDSIKKIQEIREQDQNITIEVDGGVKPENIKSLADAGVNLFVVGSYLQKNEDTKETVDRLLKIAGN